MPEREVSLLTDEAFFALADVDQFAYIASLSTDGEREFYRTLRDRRREQRRDAGFGSPTPASVTANKVWQARMRRQAAVAAAHEATHEAQSLVKTLIVGVRRIQGRASSSRVVVARNSSSRVVAASPGGSSGRPGRPADELPPLGEAVTAALAAADRQVRPGELLCLAPVFANVAATIREASCV